MSDWKENVTGAMPCKSFDMVDVWFRDGDLSSGFASDFYWKIDHDIADIIKYRVRDNKAETPEEKEAFDSMANNSELPNGSEWDGEGLPPVGVECEKIFDGSSQIITPLCYDDHIEGMVMFYYCDSGASISARYDWCLVENCIFRKPKTPQQREGRERMEAINEMLSNSHKSIGEYHEVKRRFAGQLYDAGYRKAK